MEMLKEDTVRLRLAGIMPAIASQPLNYFSISQKYFDCGGTVRLCPQTQWDQMSIRCINIAVSNSAYW